MADGQWFQTAAAARDHLRKPLVAAALKKVANGNEKLGAFLAGNEDEIQKAFESGVICRVTKSERNKLVKALTHLATLTDGKLKFIQDNVDAIASSFSWPSVKRMSPEEKAVATKAALVALADENAAIWIIANQDAILDAYSAGIEKREANPKAMEALAKAREVRAAAMAAKEAAMSPEEREKVQAAREKKAAKAAA